MESATSRSLLDDVEDYLNQSGEKPTSFGLAAMRDPQFVFRLRRGRRVREDTAAKVRDYIRARRERRAA